MLSAQVVDSLAFPLYPQATISMRKSHDGGSQNETNDLVMSAESARGSLKFK